MPTIEPIIPVPDEKANATQDAKDKDQPPAFSKRCAAVMNSRYWSDVDTAAEYEQRSAERDELVEAMKGARSVKDIPEELRAVFRKAERMTAKYEDDEEPQAGTTPGLLY